MYRLYYLNQPIIKVNRIEASNGIRSLENGKIIKVGSVKYISSNNNIQYPITDKGKSGVVIQDNNRPIVAQEIVIM